MAVVQASLRVKDERLEGVIARDTRALKRAVHRLFPLPVDYCVHNDAVRLPVEQAGPSDL